MGPQSYENPNFKNFKTPIWKSQDKCHLNVGLAERHKIYYKGKGDGFSQVRAVVSLVSSSLPMICSSTKNAQTMH
jgi:hypothetical protein